MCQIHAESKTDHSKQLAFVRGWLQARQEHLSEKSDTPVVRRYFHDERSDRLSVQRIWILQDLKRSCQGTCSHRKRCVRSMRAADSATHQEFGHLFQSDRVSLDRADANPPRPTRVCQASHARRRDRTRNPHRKDAQVPKLVLLGLDHSNWLYLWVSFHQKAHE